MKNFKRAFWYSLITGCALLIYVIYDYYVNNLLEGWIMLIILFLLWLSGLILSIVHIFRNKEWKIRFIPVISCISFALLSLFYPDMVDNTKLRDFTLPRKVNFELLQEEPFVYYNVDSTYAGIIREEPPTMAFGSGHKYIGLYKTDKFRIEDEIVLGEFPVEIVKWDKNTIHISVYQYNMPDKVHMSYITQWFERKNHLGEFQLMVDIYVPDK